MNTPAHRQPHSLKLDFLRILLCAGVLLCHFWPGYHTLAGNVSVLGFFVLSGYLLQASFYRMGASFDVEKFYASKAKRLLPFYFFSLAVAITPLVLSDNKDFVILPHNEPVASVFGYVFVLNYPAWFMNCLIVFILIAPALWWLHKVRKGIVLLFILSLLFSAFLFWRYNGTPETLMGCVKMKSMAIQPQVRLWQFLAGMVMCRVMNVASVTPLLRIFFSAGLVMLLIGVFLWGDFCYNEGKAVQNTFLFDVLIVSLMALLIAMWDDGRAEAGPRLKHLCLWASSLTYGVYLLHIPVCEALYWAVGYLTGLQLSHWAHTLLTLGVTVLLADAFARIMAQCRRKC